jgi:hypothetical protein
MFSVLDTDGCFFERLSWSQTARDCAEETKMG